MVLRNLSAPSLEALCSKEQIELLDSIDHLRLQGINHYISLPQIIVCGDQSSGKSSVLEAISGVSFPIRSSLCTRFPTELVLRKSSQVGVCVSIVPHRSRSESEQEALAQFHEELDSFEGLPQLIENAKSAMGIYTNAKSFSNDLLRVEVSGPDRPHLTIVDLPGLIHSETKQQSAADVELVHEVVKSYMEEPRSIILAVVSAKNDVPNQIVLKLARAADPYGTRTLGVITKPDTLVHGSDSEAQFVSLAKNQEVEFRLGWHALKNMDTEKGTWTLPERDKEESAFFASGVWEALPRSHVGIDRLRERLSKLLLAQIATELPSLMEEIKAKMEDCLQKLEKLGEPRTTQEEQRSYLFHCSQSFQNLVNSAVEGTYSDPFFENAKSETGYKRRIRAVVQNLNEQFTSRMKRRGHYYEIDDDVDDEDEDSLGGQLFISREHYIRHVENLLRRTRGKELPGTFNPMIINDLFIEQSQPWERITSEHVREVWEAAKAFVKIAVTEVTDMSTSSAILMEVFDPSLDSVLKSLENKTCEILRAYREGHPITYNHSFTDSLQQTRQDTLMPKLSYTIRKFFNVPQLTSSQNIDGTFDLLHLRDSLLESFKADTARFAALQALDCMRAYYKVALKRFVDAIAIEVIETALVQALVKIFSPVAVYNMSSSLESQAIQAARNEVNGFEAMSVLLEDYGDELEITEEVVKTAARNARSGAKVLALLLEKRGYEVKITEEVVKAAAENEQREGQVLALLFEQREDEVIITEGVVKAAAGNRRSAETVLALLLEKRGHEVMITEEVVKAAAGNWRSGERVLALLLEKRGNDVMVTDKVVKAAAGNWRSGERVLALLLEKQGGNFEVTENLVSLIAGKFGARIMALLLKKRGDEVMITEEVVRAAAGNEWSGEKVLALLVEERGDEVMITEEVLKAAAGNEGSGEKVLALLEKSQDGMGMQAKDELIWIRKLQSTGYSLQEIANLLFDEEHDTPWIYFEPAERAQFVIQPNRHVPRCSHHYCSDEQESSEDSQKWLPKEGSAADDYGDVIETVEELCGLAGISPTTRTKSDWFGSVDFSEGNQLAAVSYTLATDETHMLSVHGLWSRISQALEKFCCAAGLIQARNLCCNSFTFLRLRNENHEARAKIPGEVVRVDFRLIVDLAEALRSKILRWQQVGKMSAKCDILGRAEDVLDTWGPGNFVFRRDMRGPPVAIKLGDGFIFANKSGKCHWARGMDDVTDLDYINLKEPLLIGAFVTTNTNCRLVKAECWRESSHVLEYLGTMPSSWAKSQQQLTFQFGQYVVGQLAQTWNKQRGITVKEMVLSNPDNEQLIQFMDEYWGVQVSYCTGVARRVLLRTLVADLIPSFSKDLCLEYAISRLRDQPLKPGEIQTWLNALGDDLREKFLKVVRKILDTLRPTGVDPTGKSFCVAWPFEGDTSRCFKIPIERHSTWVRILSDSQDCATFVYITMDCLETDCFKCSGIPDAIHTNICVLATAVIRPLREKPKHSWTLKHEEVYFFSKLDTMFWVKVRREHTTRPASLVELLSMHSIPHNLRRRLYLSQKKKQQARLRECHTALAPGEPVSVFSIHER
ncbi:hypothetical protein ACP6JB_007675 [Aspergillus fumigatus]